MALASTGGSRGAEVLTPAEVRSELAADGVAAVEPQATTPSAGSDRGKVRAIIIYQRFRPESPGSPVERGVHPIGTVKARCAGDRIRTFTAVLKPGWRWARTSARPTPEPALRNSFGVKFTGPGSPSTLYYYFHCGAGVQGLIEIWHPDLPVEERGSGDRQPTQPEQNRLPASR